MGTPFYFSAYLQLQQYHLKQTALQRFHQQHTVCLHLPLAEAENLSAGDEIQIGNEMFDIEKVVQQQNQALVYGWYDAEEADLKAELFSLTARQHNRNPQSDATGKLLQFFLMLFVHPSPMQIYFTGHLSTIAYTGLTVHFVWVCLPVATPPPVS